MRDHGAVCLVYEVGDLVFAVDVGDGGAEQLLDVSLWVGGETGRRR